MIENDDKTLEIISEEEIERCIKGVTRSEMIIPFSAIEDALKIFESLGCGYQNLKLISYYCLSDQGFLLVTENEKFGIKFKEKLEEKEE